MRGDGNKFVFVSSYFPLVLRNGLFPCNYCDLRLQRQLYRFRFQNTFERKVSLTPTKAYTTKLNIRVVFQETRPGETLITTKGCSAICRAWTWFADWTEWQTKKAGPSDISLNRLQHCDPWQRVTLCGLESAWRVNCVLGMPVIFISIV